MKIVVLLTSVFDVIGGIHTFNRALIRAFDDLSIHYGLEIEVLSILDGPASTSVMQQYLPSGNVRFNGFRGNRIAFGLRAIRAGRDADWVVFGHINLVPLTSLLRRPTKSLVIHGVDVWQRLSLVKRIGVSHVDEVLSVSSYTESAMVAHNGVPPVRFDFFPNTLDPRFPVKTTDFRKPALPKRYFLTVTRLDRGESSKNIETVIRSLPQILSSVPDAYYVIVGKGAGRKSLARAARSLGVADRVIFTGAVADAELPCYYESCDLFVLASVKEGFGIVFLEAMYYAKPCIGANAGGIPEVIVDGQTGIIPKSTTPPEIAGCIIRLLQNPEERDRLGRQGRQRLETRFSFTSFRGRLEAIIRAHGCVRLEPSPRAVAQTIGTAH